MSDPPTKAVFISHASQDDEAAKRICAGLRSGGVEVWFDSEGGLEHGDEWDAKIRQQIKECVLFIPIISAATQARHEGYFRIEWDLAAERSRGFASGVPFILPVVIDEVREPEALVPDRFRSVQWIKLPGGKVTPDFLARFLKLWSHRTGVLSHEAAQAGAAGTLPAMSGSHSSARDKRWGLVTALSVALLVMGVVTWWSVARKAPGAATVQPASPEKSESTEAAAPDPKSVAVLPFENLSDDKENEYFSEGISDELLNVLAKIPGLHVAARTSSFYFRGRNATAQEIGAKLGVANLVEGSVRRSGNTVRIAARMSRAATGEQTWSESYTRDLSDVFAVQTELAQTIVAQLRQQLGAPVAKAEIAAQVQAAEKGGTANAEAHRLYLEGRYYLSETSLEAINRGADLLQRALELDPGYVKAWASLARAGSLINGFGEDAKDVERGMELSRRSARKALELAPDVAEGHLAETDVHLDEFDWKGASESVRRAMQLDPGNAEVIDEAAVVAMALGDIDRAVELGRKAEALDPVNPLIKSYLGFALYAKGRYKDAIDEFVGIQHLSPSSAWGFGGLPFCYMAEGEFDKAEQAAEQCPTDWLRMVDVSMAQWSRGKHAESDAALQQLIGKFADVAAYQVAEAYGFRGDGDHAFQWLERAFRQHDPGLERLKFDGSFKGLYSDPRWDVFLRKLGLADDQVNFGSI